MDPRLATFTKVWITKISRERQLQWISSHRARNPRYPFKKGACWGGGETWSVERQWKRGSECGALVSKLCEARWILAFYRCAERCFILKWGRRKPRRIAKKGLERRQSMLAFFLTLTFVHDTLITGAGGQGVKIAPRSDPFWLCRSALRPFLNFRSALQPLLSLHAPTYFGTSAPRSDTFSISAQRSSRLPALLFFFLFFFRKKSKKKRLHWGNIENDYLSKHIPLNDIHIKCLWIKILLSMYKLHFLKYTIGIHINY